SRPRRASGGELNVRAVLPSSQGWSSEAKPADGAVRTTRGGFCFRSIHDAGLTRVHPVSPDDFRRCEEDGLPGQGWRCLRGEAEQEARHGGVARFCTNAAANLRVERMDLRIDGGQVLAGGRLEATSLHVTDQAGGCITGLGNDAKASHRLDAAGALVLP